MAQAVSLATIYKSMFEFMVLQRISIAFIIAFPALATKFPRQSRKNSASKKVEKIDDSGNRLEEDPYKAGMEKWEKTR